MHDIRDPDLLMKATTINAEYTKIHLRKKLLIAFFSTYLIYSLLGPLALG